MTTFTGVVENYSKDNSKNDWRFSNDDGTRGQLLTTSPVGRDKEAGRIELAPYANQTLGVEGDGQHEWICEAKILSHQQSAQYSPARALTTAAAATDPAEHIFAAFMGELAPHAGAIAAGNDKLFPHGINDISFKLEIGSIKVDFQVSGDKGSQQPLVINRPPIMHEQLTEERRVLLLPDFSLQQELAHSRKAEQAYPQEIDQRAPLFDVPATLRGNTSNFHVYYQSSLGATGAAAADAMLQTCDRDNHTMAAWFGASPASFNVIILDHSNGAYHYGCTGTDLYCDIGPANPDHTRMLMAAEAVEVYEALGGRGWNCGASNGEGLSRVLSTELYPTQLNGFKSASWWLNHGRPDWVSNTDDSDTNYVSIGCAVLFLNWLHVQLKHSWAEIAQAGGGTLEDTYRRLTGKSNAFPVFKALLDKHFQPGTTATLPTDNPFPLQ
jgi:hypothetical protein